MPRALRRHLTDRQGREQRRGKAVNIPPLQSAIFLAALGNPLEDAEEGLTICVREFKVVLPVSAADDAASGDYRVSARSLGPSPDSG